MPEQEFTIVMTAAGVVSKGDEPDAAEVPPPKEEEKS